MSGSTFGRLFAVTNFGESHGPAIGCVIDGCPPGLALSEADIQPDLDRRRPGTSRHVTQRQEADAVEILSGLFEGRTLGTAIGFTVRNEDADARAAKAKEDAERGQQIAASLTAMIGEMEQVLAADTGQGFMLLTDLGNTTYLKALTEDRLRRR